MRQVVLADNNLGLDPQIVRVTQYFNNTAFRVALAVFEVHDFCDYSIAISGTARVFRMNQDIEKKAVVFRDNQACLPACLIGADDKLRRPVDYLDDYGLASFALFSYDPEKDPVAMMGAPQVVRRNKRVLA